MYIAMHKTVLFSLSLLSLLHSGFCLAKDGANSNSILFYEGEQLNPTQLKSAFSYKDCIVIALRNRDKTTEILGTDLVSGEIKWRIEEEDKSEPFKLGNYVVTQNKFIIPQTGKKKISSPSISFKKAGSFAIAFNNSSEMLYTFSSKAKLLRKTPYPEILLKKPHYLSNGNILGLSSTVPHSNSTDQDADCDSNI